MDVEDLTSPLSHYLVILEKCLFYQSLVLVGLPTTKPDQTRNMQHKRSNEKQSGSSDKHAKHSKINV